MQLSQSVVKDDAYRRGKIQASDFLLWHGNDERAILITREHFRRQPARFGAEKEAIARFDTHPRVRARSMGTQAENALKVGKRAFEIGHGGVLADFDMRPIVEAGA